MVARLELGEPDADRARCRSDRCEGRRPRRAGRAPLDHFQRPDGDPVVAEIEEKHGTPGENPAFWRAVSPLTYVDRVTEPLLMQHGTADDTCPLTWSRQVAGAFEKAGKDVELRTHAGEGHTFGPRWPASMDLTEAFFARHLRRAAQTRDRYSPNPAIRTGSRTPVARTRHRRARTASGSSRIRLAPITAARATSSQPPSRYARGAPRRIDLPRASTCAPGRCTVLPTYSPVSPSPHAEEPL
ncbi:alpha/beta hydrolase family protein [Streptomyces sp. NPDC050164]|uniref:alpha/beta hydrolase family protein n=1 Tax=Streptomyces sp. NPDC050164 TaxID=3365605 RepID=UPI0037A10839